MKVKSPYNFAPLNKKVYFPSWGDLASQDKPFSDGEQGIIEISVEAQSPLFIGGAKLADGSRASAHNSATEQNPLVFPGAHKNGLGAFIPGTSIKGMLRHAMEVISFAKIQNLSKAKHSMRDLNDKDSPYKNGFINKAKDIHAGWLTKQNGRWTIEDWGKPGRISHAEIDQYLGTDFVDSFKQGGKAQLTKDKEKAASFKYDKIERLKGERLVRSKISHLKDGPIHSIYSFDSIGGSKDAILVCTGQPGPRKNIPGKKPSGKFYEFLFIPPHKKETLTVGEEQKANFEEAVHEHDEANTNLDWKYWKEVLKKEGGRVPVFFRKQGRTIIDFGLSFMYRLPYEHSVADLVDRDHHSERIDLVETIFGKLGDTPLKGRVQVGHSFMQEGRFLETKSFMLASPRSSFYPYYLEQTGAKLSNFNSPSARIRGRKFYPIAKNYSQETKQGTGSDKMYSFLRPVAEGAKFHGEIAVHNLRPVEIGALLSTLLFHNTAECYHRLGMAKPLGYGRVKITTKLIGFQYSSEDYLAAFESEMNYFLKSDWRSDSIVQEYFKLHRQQKEVSQEDLAYLPEPKDFAEIKKDKSFLKPFGQWSGVEESVDIPPASSAINWTEGRERFEQAIAEAMQAKEEHRAALEAKELEMKLEKEREERERKQRAEEQKQAQRIAREQEEIKQRQAARQEQAQAEGLMHIVSLTDDKRLIKEVDNFLRKMGTEQLDAAYWPDLRQGILSCANKANKKTLQKRFLNDKAPLWNKLKGWGVEGTITDAIKTELTNIKD